MSVVQIYTTFYCRTNEPSYIKQLKLEILAVIADDTNAYDIATELTEYIHDADVQLAREAVRAVGRIALEVSRLPLLSLLVADRQPMQYLMLRPAMLHSAR